MRQEALKEGKGGLFGLLVWWYAITVGKGVAGGARCGWSHYDHSQEAKRKMNASAQLIIIYSAQNASPLDSTTHTLQLNLWKCTHRCAQRLCLLDNSKSRY